ncbi:MAG: roadblock/LC7 domain-containing protein [Actinomycetota bacterium]
MELVKTAVDPQRAPLAAPAAPAEPSAHLVLADIVRGAPGARAAVLVSADGFAVASTGSADPTANAAMAAAALGLGRQLATSAGGQDLRQLVIDHDGGLIFVWPVGDRRAVCVFADNDVDQRGLRRLVRVHGARLMESA